jgi:hypothetical protein
MDEGPFRATPCCCGHPTCRAWHVAPVANVQGVSFTEHQAKLVAQVLNDDEQSVKEWNGG